MYFTRGFGGIICGSQASRPNNPAAWILQGSFFALIDRGLCGPQIGIKKRLKLHSRVSRPFLARYMGPGWGQD